MSGRFLLRDHPQTNMYRITLLPWKSLRKLETYVRMAGYHSQPACVLGHSAADVIRKLGLGVFPVAFVTMRSARSALLGMAGVQSMIALIRLNSKLEQ